MFHVEHLWINILEEEEIICLAASFRVIFGSIKAMYAK